MERLAANESGESVVRAFRAFERIDWPRATASSELALREIESFLNGGEGLRRREMLAGFVGVDRSTINA